MSLICHECDTEMQPSDSLPGREGILVYPNVLSMVWVPEDLAKIGWSLVYDESKIWSSLCFECVESKVPTDRHKSLEYIYEVYETETKHDEIRESQKGRFIGGEELGLGCDAWDKFQAKISKINFEECLICGGQIRKGRRPFFAARTLNRVYCRKHLSGLSILGTNYSWSHLKTGITSFRFCFDCFQLFPNCFRALSYNLRREVDPQQTKLAGAELYISEEVLDKFKEELGPEEFEKFLREFKVKRAH